MGDMADEVFEVSKEEKRKRKKKKKRERHVEIPKELESFPLLPLAVIPSLDHDLLRLCKKELKRLLRKLEREAESSSKEQNAEPEDQLLEYVRRELAAVREEWKNRAALRRIQRLIENQEELVLKPYTEKEKKISPSTATPSNEGSLDSDIRTEDKNNEEVHRTPEAHLEEAKSSTCPEKGTLISSTEKLSQRGEANTAKEASAQRTETETCVNVEVPAPNPLRPKASGQTISGGIRANAKSETNVKAKKQRPKSRNRKSNEGTPRSHIRQHSDQHAAGRQASIEHSSEKSKERGIPLKKLDEDDSKAEEKRKEREAAERRRQRLIQQTWGNVFVVPGNKSRRKRRAVPKKPVEEPPEVILERKRKERRKLAQERLRQRQEKVRQQRAKEKSRKLALQEGKEDEQGSKTEQERKDVECDGPGTLGQRLNQGGDTLSQKAIEDSAGPADCDRVKAPSTNIVIADTTDEKPLASHELDQPARNVEPDSAESDSNVENSADEQQQEPFTDNARHEEAATDRADVTSLLNDLVSSVIDIHDLKSQSGNTIHKGQSIGGKGFADISVSAQMSEGYVASQNLSEPEESKAYCEKNGGQAAVAPLEPTLQVEPFPTLSRRTQVEDVPLSKPSSIIEYPPSLEETGIDPSIQETQEITVAKDHEGSLNRSSFDPQTRVDTLTQTKDGTARRATDETSFTTTHSSNGDTIHQALPPTGSPQVDSEKISHKPPSEPLSVADLLKVLGNPSFMRNEAKPSKPVDQTSTTENPTIQWKNQHGNEDSDISSDDDVGLEDRKDGERSRELACETQSFAADHRQCTDKAQFQNFCRTVRGLFTYFYQEGENDKTDSGRQPGRKSSSHGHRFRQGRDKSRGFIANENKVEPIVQPQDADAAEEYGERFGGGGLIDLIRFQLRQFEVWEQVMDDYNEAYGSGNLRNVVYQYRVYSAKRPELKELIGDVLHSKMGWRELPSGYGLNNTWNLLWTWSKPKVEYESLLAWQKVNHFPKSHHLTRKDLLKKHLAKFQALNANLRSAFDIMPQSFVLPADYVHFVQSFSNQVGGENIWILKPVGLSRGRGISVIGDLSQVRYGDAAVIQKYVENPLLLDGHKFDLRLYVLVTSFNPLEAFLYDEGFIRLSTLPFSLEKETLHNLFVHLTNSSINRHRDSPLTSEEAVAEDGGTKNSLTYLWRVLRSRGIDVDSLWDRIQEVVVKSLVCVEEHIPFQVNSFELFGYDILIDQDLRPWLLEVNASPSMGRDCSLDYKIKDQLIADTIKLVDPPPFDRLQLLQMLRETLQELEDEKKRKSLYGARSETSEEKKQKLAEDLQKLFCSHLPREIGDPVDSPNDASLLGRAQIKSEGSNTDQLGQSAEILSLRSKGKGPPSYVRLCPNTRIYRQVTRLKRMYIRSERDKPEKVVVKP